MKFPMIGLLNTLLLAQKHTVVQRVIAWFEKNNLNVLHEKL